MHLQSAYEVMAIAMVYIVQSNASICGFPCCNMLQLSFIQAVLSHTSPMSLQSVSC